MIAIVFVRRVAAILFWLFLLLDLFAWAGLCRDPEVGVAVSKSVNREGVLARVYAGAGQPLVDAMGMENAAVAFAGQRFADARRAVAANPGAAMDVIGARMGFGMRMLHYGAPLLGIFWLLLWWRRPRSVRTFGRR